MWALSHFSCREASHDCEALIVASDFTGNISGEATMSMSNNLVEATRQWDCLIAESRQPTAGVESILISS